MRHLAILAALALFAAGCSGSTGTSSGSTSTGGTTGSSGAAAFAGQWRLSGNFSATCGGSTQSGGLTSPSPNYTVTFAQGASGLVSVDDYGCTVHWTVSGNTATSEANPTCSVAGTTYAITSGSITLTVVDATHLSGSADVSGTQSNCGNATATAAGTLTKQ